MTRTAAFISHPCFHAPGFGAHHPLSTGRQRAVVELVQTLGWLDPAAIVEAPMASRDVLRSFHAETYLDALMRACTSGVATADDRSRYNLGTMECPVFPGLWERACRSVGGSIRAAELALSGTVAFHPAGGTHHGRPDRASGFCYFNDPVFAIRRLLSGGLGQVAYVDLDAHHGDGVEDAVRGDRRVAFFSIHEAGRWPGTGQTSTSPDGRIVNYAVPPGFGDDRYRALIAASLRPWLKTFAREGVVICLGADALAGDPLSRLGLTNGTLWDTTAECVSEARHAVVLGGGGYNPWTSARLWAGQWGLLAGHDVTMPLPADARAILAGLSSDLVDDDEIVPDWYTTLEDPRPTSTTNSEKNVK
jgi:acetoin utilization protein AcuC